MSARSQSADSGIVSIVAQLAVTGDSATTAIMIDALKTSASVAFNAIQGQRSRGTGAASGSRPAASRTKKRGHVVASDATPTSAVAALTTGPAASPSQRAKQTS